MSSRILAFGLLASSVAAWPAAVMDSVMKSPELTERMSEALSSLDKRAYPKADGATAVFEAKPVFNKAAQYVDVTDDGPNPWKAPGPNDLRGPCPGLNAFANHGFLPRNGYATIAQFIDATTNVVGMGADLAAFLAVFGAAIDGSGTAWSIGGKPKASLGLGGALGPGNGITNSHNKYESDASPTRPDLYEYGNDYKTRVPQYQLLINMSPGGSVDLDSLTAFRSKRFDQSIAGNPYFFNGPFTGVLVQPAAYTFIYRFMANHSADAPVGYLSYDTLASWFAISGSSGSYSVKQGYERIPYNWYKRSVVAPYTIPYFNLDLTNAALIHPKFFSVGGNTGKVNTFTPVDVSDLSGGVYNSADLLKGNNAACLAFQFAAQAKPDVLAASLTRLTSTLGSISSKLSCPNLQAIDDSQLNKYPGYTRSPAA